MAHPRAASGTATLSNHMPADHRHYAEWSAEHFLSRARQFGPSTQALIAAILADRHHPEQGYRSCQGALKLFRGANGRRAEAVPSFGPRFVAQDVSRSQDLSWRRISQVGRLLPASWVTMI